MDLAAHWQQATRQRPLILRREDRTFGECIIAESLTDKCAEFTCLYSRLVVHLHQRAMLEDSRFYGNLPKM